MGTGGLLTLEWTVLPGATGRLAPVVAFSRCLGGSLAASFRAEELADAESSNGLFAGTTGEMECEGLETWGPVDAER